MDVERAYHLDGRDWANEQNMNSLNTNAIFPHTTDAATEEMFDSLMNLDALSHDAIMPVTNDTTVSNDDFWSSECFADFGNGALTNFEFFDFTSPQICQNGFADSI